MDRPISIQDWKLFSYCLHINIRSPISSLCHKHCIINIRRQELTWSSSVCFYKCDVYKEEDNPIIHVILSCWPLSLYPLLMEYFAVFMCIFKSSFVFHGDAACLCAVLFYIDCLLSIFHSALSLLIVLMLIQVRFMFTKAKNMRCDVRDGLICNHVFAHLRVFSGVVQENANLIFWRMGIEDYFLLFVVISAFILPVIHISTCLFGHLSFHLFVHLLVHSFIHPYA